MARVMGGKSYMLGEAESVKNIKEGGNIRSQGIVEVQVKVSGDDEFRG
jgi:hypothetical protein